MLLEAHKDYRKNILNEQSVQNTRPNLGTNTFEIAQALDKDLIH